ncbi:MAG: fluoride efflux transporter CrcB [Litorivicinus sp.]
MMTYLAVALGGALGACARFAIAGVFKSPMGTLVANGIGCFLIGLLAGWLASRAQFDAALRPLLMTGFLGALTTYSTFSLEAMAMFNEGKVSQAVGYIGATLLISLSTCALGLSLARSI